ncbi:MAG: SAM-dependent methyltransferase [Pirellulaceae bacterium]|nr:MAG: SAM-dependent methyltransferase [Pirellulaceae bacterium]
MSTRHRYPRKPARGSRRGWTPAKLRIVAGELGGRKIEYNGDPETRPMKERTREAVFSLLGGYLPDMLAIDLFSGTGILGFEAISRGASAGILLELSRTSVSHILQNAEKLRILDRVQVHHVDTLRWVRGGAVERLPQHLPWVVFLCPPYRMWHEQTEALGNLLAAIFHAAPPHSQFICEADERFDLATTFPLFSWDMRHYPPARVGVLRKREVHEEQDDSLRLSPPSVTE